MPELTSEYRTHLRDNATRYGDPLIVQLLDALETAEALAEERTLDASALINRALEDEQRILSAEAQLIRLSDRTFKACDLVAQAHRGTIDPADLVAALRAVFVL